MIVYLGAAIDTSLGSPAEQFSELSNAVIKAAGETSVILFNPFTAFINAHAITDEKDMKFLIKTNNSALDNAGLAVFSWTTSPSMGVPLEIQRRKKRRTPMVIWNRTPKKLGIYLRQGLGEEQIIVDSAEELDASLTNWFLNDCRDLELLKPHKTEPLPEPTLGLTDSVCRPPGVYVDQLHKKTFMRDFPPKATS